MTFTGAIWKLNFCWGYSLQVGVLPGRKFSFHIPLLTVSGDFSPGLTFDPVLFKTSCLSLFFALILIQCISYFSGSFTMRWRYLMASSRGADNQETQTSLPLIDQLTLFNSVFTRPICRSPPRPFFFLQKEWVLLRRISCMWKLPEPRDKTGNFTSWALK